MPDDGMVNRQCVGGPLDGVTVTVGRNSHHYQCPTRTPVLSWDPPTITTRHDVVTYSLATAPTGERVFLAAGVTDYPDRFDTPAWVRLIAPHLTDLTRVGDWLWRGREPQPADVDGFTYRGWCRWTYLMISPDNRYKMQVQDVDDLRRISGHRMEDVDQTVGERMRRQMMYNRLPTCPDFDCDEKASETVTPIPGGGPAVVYGQVLGYRQVFALCPTHTSLVLMMSRGLRPGRSALDQSEEDPDGYVNPRVRRAVRYASWAERVATPPFRINIY